MPVLQSSKSEIRNPKEDRSAKSENRVAAPVKTGFSYKIRLLIFLYGV